MDDDQQDLAALRALQVNGFDPLAAARDYPRLEAENAKLRDALDRIAAMLDENLNGSKHESSLYSGSKVSKKTGYQMALVAARAALTR